jgi:ferrous iron transport protein B
MSNAIGREKITIALAGNPNSGKTTLFNALTGANQFVGNWPGVTVEKKEGKLKGYEDVTITDLPGIYSLSPYTLEEVVARNYLVQDRPDAILDIVDGTNLERNLYLTTQLTELGIPVIIAVNMMDVVNKKGDTIDLKELEKAMGVKAVPISALKETGIKEAAKAAVDAARADIHPSPAHNFSGVVEHALAHIEEACVHDYPDEQQRWYAIKIFERDEKVMEQLKLDQATRDHIEKDIEAAEAELDDDAESIITDQRYNYITSIINRVIKKKDKGKLSVSDKIDKVVTNRWLALPIFAIVMLIVYYVSVTTVGGWVTDFTNDQLFGDGYHLFSIGTADYEKAAEAYEIPGAQIEAFEGAAEKEGVDPADAKDLTTIAYLYDDDGNVTDEIPTDYEDYQKDLTIEEPDPADYGVWVPGIPVLVEKLLDALKVPEDGWLHGLVIDGIVAGVGAVLGFVPQMFVLFLFLAFLESCGYMARIAFVMDRIFRKFGLSGKSFIPVLIGTGCGVPGIMSTRTIENERDRRMTVMTTTFIPCGAKLPIIALISGALFHNSGLIAVSAYFLGIASIIISGIMLKKTKMFAGDPAPFVMELPAYHWPTVGNLLRSMWERGWSFIKKAGSIILLATILIWFLSGFGFVNGSFGMVDMDQSMLAAFGNAIAPIFNPLGWGNWRAAVATITGLIAKENVVGTFGILYGAGSDVAENGWQIWNNVAAHFTPLSAYSFLAFNLLCAPCFAAIGAIKREMNSAKWTWFAIAYQCGWAYTVSLIIYQIGCVFTGNMNVLGLIAALVMIGVIIYMLVRPYKEATDLKVKVRV